MPDVPSSPGSSSDRCTRCATDLSALSPLARFCPRCGLRLSDDRPKTSARPERDAPPPPPDPVFTHGIVRGYASAMFRLGAHYEVRHNGHEAVRCYGKASRLGNEPAKARLAKSSLAAQIEPNDAPPADAPPA